MSVGGVGVHFVYLLFGVSGQGLVPPDDYNYTLGCVYGQAISSGLRHIILRVGTSLIPKASATCFSSTAPRESSQPGRR